MSFVTRLAQPRDLDALAALSEHADPRVYTLARGRDAVRQAIERSLESVMRQVDVPADEHYLLVLERQTDGGGGELVGTAALRSTAGSQGTFFCFRNDVIHHASHDLKVSSNVHVLTLLGDVALQVGDHKKAQQMYRALLLQKLDDANGPIKKSMVFFRLGQIHEQLDEKPKAVQMYERAVQTDGLDEAKARLAALKG